MQDKRPTTLYLSDRLVNKCKAKMNLSETVNDILRILVEQKNIFQEQISLAVLLSEQDKVDKEIERLTIEITRLSTVKGSLTKRVNRQKVIVDEILRSIEIAQLIKQLNGKIAEHDYDLNSIKEAAKDEIDRLKELGMGIDDKWLNRQIQRIELL